MRISEVARLAGTTVRTISHYHAIGLLDEPERLPNGYRDYCAADLLCVLRIRQLASLGFSLGQVAQVLEQLDAVPGGDARGERGAAPDVAATGGARGAGTSRPWRARGAGLRGRGGPRPGLTGRGRSGGVDRCRDDVEERGARCFSPTDVPPLTGGFASLACGLRSLEITLSKTSPFV